MKVFITGASRGFGEELLEAFYRNNWDVVANSRTIETGHDNRIERVGMDMKDINQWIFTLYTPNVIINNAFDKENCYYSMEGQIHLLKEAIKYFEYVGKGTIINVNSVAGLIADTKDPDYCAAKHGLRAYSEAVKHEARFKGINIIDLYPGGIAIGMAEGRKDFNQLMNPRELANFIVTLCTTESFVVSHIEFNRTCSTKEASK